MSTMTNPYAPPKATVRDISMPEASLVYADRGTRLGAALLDGLIFMLMVYLPLVIFVAGGAAFATSTADGTSAAADAVPVMFMLGGGAALIGLAVWGWFTYKFAVENGQTIAKRWLNIKVLRSDGSPVSIGRLFWLRNVVNALLGIVPLYGIVDILFIFGEAQQCLHDKIADTIVVKA